MPDTTDHDRRARQRARTSPLLLVGVGIVAVTAFVAAIAMVGADQRTNGATQPPAALTPSSPATEESVAAPVDPLEGITLDPLQEVRIAELRDFIAWLNEQGADGYIGEFGWSREDDDWNALGDYWYRVADDAGLWTSMWAAGSRWGESYRLTVYDAQPSTEGLNTAYSPATILELPGRVGRHGVNLAGLEFGTQRAEFSSGQPGTLGQDYFDEPAASFSFLAERGIDLVRLPFAWERLQPALGAPLDADYTATIERMLDAAADNGIDVVLDLHNYAAYTTPDGRLSLGTESLPGSALSDVWLRIAERWGGHPAVVAYGLMNEPQSLPADSPRQAAARWETISQQTVIDLREAGDTTLLMVAGYDYSSVPRWRQNHPTGWIDDPADNFRYEGHHYWDNTGEGAYTLPYADERALVGG